MTTDNNSSESAQSKPVVTTDEEIILAAAQLILSEKRTSLSLLRTGIAVFALPMAVISALIATSRFYDSGNVSHLLIPIMVLNAVLIALGCYLVVHAMLKIHRHDRLIRQLRNSHPAIAPYLD